MLVVTRRRVRRAQEGVLAGGRIEERILGQ